MIGQAPLEGGSRKEQPDLAALPHPDPMLRTSGAATQHG